MTRPVAPWLVLISLLAAVAVPALGIAASASGPVADGSSPDTASGVGERTGVAVHSGSAGGAVAEPGASADPTLDHPSQSRGIGGPLQTQEFDRTEFHITVYGNGSARWTFIYRKNLENESEVEQFEAFAEEFNRNETELYRNFQDRAVDLARQGTNTTGRQMEARNFSRQAATNTQVGDQGVVRMSFLWTNFARTDGNRVLIEDVFEGGLYLGSNQVLYFHRGPGLRFQEGVRPPPDENESTTLAESQWIRYHGEQQFGSYRPYVPLAPPAGTETDGSAGDGTDTPIPSGGFGILPWAVLALLVLLGLGAGVAYRSGALSTPGNDGGTAGTAATDDGAAATEPAVPDEELLSDEDRVLQLLDEHGGRMKQVNIVEETGWSKSKVSMLLSDMEEEDQISKLRVGRENIISLKGEEPDAAGSPFEDGE